MQQLQTDVKISSINFQGTEIEGERVEQKVSVENMKKRKLEKKNSVTISQVRMQMTGTDSTISARQHGALKED